LKIQLLYRLYEARVFHGSRVPNLKPNQGAGKINAGPFCSNVT